MTGLSHERRETIRLRWALTPDLHAGTRYQGTEEVDRRDTLELLDALEAAEKHVDAVRALHERWGDADVEDIDPLDLWEQLGAILAGAGERP